MRIRTEGLTGISVSRFQRMREVVDLDPPYQREGNVWKPGARSILIDSLINGLDVPKLYFESVSERRSTPGGLTYQYAVIDGKQRLEAILAFIDGKLALADDFIFFEDPSVDARGMTLENLQSSHPVLAQRFWSFELPIIRVTTDSGDLIEEMFQRLNASSADTLWAASGRPRESTNAAEQWACLG